MAALARRATVVVLAAVLDAACGGGATAPSPAASPSPDPAKLVVLDPGNFDALVLAPGRASLVEFQLPT